MALKFHTKCIECQNSNQYKKSFSENFDLRRKIKNFRKHTITAVFLNLFFGSIISLYHYFFIIQDFSAKINKGYPLSTYICFGIITLLSISVNIFLIYNFFRVLFSRIEYYLFKDQEGNFHLHQSKPRFNPGICTYSWLGTLTNHSIQDQNVLVIKTPIIEFKFSLFSIKVRNLNDNNWEISDFHYSNITGIDDEEDLFYTISISSLHSVSAIRVNLEEAFDFFAFYHNADKLLKSISLMHMNDERLNDLKKNRDRLCNSLLSTLRFLTKMRHDLHEAKTTTRSKFAQTVREQIEDYLRGTFDNQWLVEKLQEELKTGIPFKPEFD
ncbi:hypothetical protein A2478_02025 [Candidatus Falkowbacteria bacterium RIFOXYC2_FULL_36_12]|uniref:Uncharacterized protein n=1 Tax=Candidatus Falkowbacteria bacterium RIFOXYC2_FULL_36_12 TaxID=1798002 RepID=A0A1F5T3B7_9BACT|nr:MAG: hypothetical protein A2478_02025 [Candidatus Falkowbacteria bacterium RIFOXYC2_FULL_36_12]